MHKAVGLEPVWAPRSDLMKLMASDEISDQLRGGMLMPFRAEPMIAASFSSSVRPGKGSLPVRIRMNACVHACVHARVHARVLACMRACVHACVHV